MAAMKKLLIEWVRTAALRQGSSGGVAAAAVARWRPEEYRDKCEKVSPGLFAKLCLTASSARKKTVSSLHHCRRRRDRRRRDSRRFHKGRGGRAVAPAAIAMQWLKYSNTALLLFPKAFSWGQRNLIKSFYNQANTPLVTKIALKICFSQHSRLKEKHHLLSFKVNFLCQESSIFIEKYQFTRRDQFLLLSFFDNFN